MKNAMRWICLVLVISMLAVAFASCGGGSTGDKETTGTKETIGKQETTAETRLELGIPDSADFKEEEINFLCWYVSGWAETVRVYRDITSEGPNGDLVNDAVFDRNSLIQENYKCNIVMQLEDTGSLPGMISNQVAAGDTDYDVVMPRLLNVGGLVTSECFLNLYEVPNIDLEKPWWDQDSVDDLSFKNVLFVVASAMNVNDKDATAALAFSKTACDARGIDYFYDIAQNGEWTFEKVMEICDDIGDPDEAGDGNGVKDEEDFWGFLGKHDVSTAFYIGSGSRIVDLGDDGLLHFAADDELAIDAMDTIGELMNSNWFYNHHKTGIDDVAYTRLFETGHGMFFWMRLDEVTNMRKADIEFGILPTPKFEDTQENYYSVVSPHTTGCISIPASLAGETLDMVTTVLEALSYESYYTLQPAYIEQSLKTKYSSDEESGAMLDLILNSRVFEPGIIMSFGGFADKIQGMGATHGSLATAVATSGKATEELVVKYMKDLGFDV